jgi:hypothetical protein
MIGVNSDVALLHHVFLEDVSVVNAPSIFWLGSEDEGCMYIRNIAQNLKVQQPRNRINAMNNYH